MTVDGLQTDDAAAPADDAEIVQAGERRSARIESLRAIAALAVLVSHVWLYAHNFGPGSYHSFLGRTIAGGGFGVQLFFALSGFLIFRPFVRRDFDRGPKIDLRTYARNRAVRILPLYFVAVAVLLVFGEAGGSREQWWRFLTFSENFSPRIAQAVDGPMWSLVVEVHFYLLLPLLAWALACVARRDRLRAIVVLLVLAVPSVVLWRLDPSPQLAWQHSLPSTFFGFVPGMVLALMQLQWRDRRPGWVRGVAGSTDTWLVAAALAWAAVFWDYGWYAPGVAVASFLTVGAVVLPLRPGVLVRLLDIRALALVGIASYSLYIWHVPIIERLNGASSIGGSWLRLLVEAVPLCLAVAAFSYAVVERPVLRWRRSWARAGETPIATPRPSRLAHQLEGRRVLVALLAVAFLVRARFVMATHPLTLGSDPADYDRLGRLLAAGKGFGTSVLTAAGGPTAFRPPLYPLFLGAVYKATGGSILAARLTQSLLGAVTVALMWFIARRLFNRRVAIVAAAITALYPPLVVSSASLMSESIFVPLMLGAIAAALVARDGRHHAARWALAAGALAGLGVLARPNSAIAFPVIVALAVTGATGAGAQRNQVLRRAAAVVLAAVVVVLPWEIRNLATFHTVVPVADIDGFNLAGVYNADSATAAYPTHYQFRPPTAVPAEAPHFADRTLDEVELGTSLRNDGLHFVAQHPTAPAQAEFWNSYRMLELTGLDQSARAAHELGFGRGTAAVEMLSFWVMLAVAGAALASGAAARVPRLLWLFPVLLWLATALFLGNARLRAPVDLFLVLAAAPAVVLAVDRAAAWRARRVAVSATTAGWQTTMSSSST